MSNRDVAAFLLRNGLYNFEGVVYLDESDAKMILLRSTFTSVPLAQGSVSKSRQFTFYDDVHCVGMDISHLSNARAVVTLGKDMTFRDFVQGAFRMRGIVRGTPRNTHTRIHTRTHTNTYICRQCGILDDIYIYFVFLVFTCG